MKKVYFGGAIDEVDRDDLYARSALLKETFLRLEGVVVFDPFAAFAGSSGDLGKEGNEVISATNRWFLSQADTAVFVVDFDQNPFGTIREIEFAAALEIRVIVVTTSASMVQHVEAHDIEFASTIEGAVDLLLGATEGWRQLVDGEEETFEVADDLGDDLPGITPSSPKKNPMSACITPLDETKEERASAVLGGHLYDLMDKGHGEELLVSARSIGRAINRLPLTIDDDGDGTVTVSFEN